MLSEKIEAMDHLHYKTNKEFLELLKEYEKIVFTDKVFKYSPYHYIQKRCFVITNKHVYNIEDPYNFKETTKRVSIFNIAALSITEEGNLEFIIHDPSQYDLCYLSRRCNPFINIGGAR